MNTGRFAPHTLNFLAAMQTSGPVQALPGLAAVHLLHVRRASMSYEVMTTCAARLQPQGNNCSSKLAEVLRLRPSNAYML